MMDKMKTAQVVILHEIIEQNELVINGKYYCFQARIKEINNQSNPWYEACSRCTKKVTRTLVGIECSNCSDINISEVPRFHLNLNVVSETHTTNVAIWKVS
ncbi:hypothetical protein Leryth_020815 [Lithospermum erythrorhizon]|nr:hypothetical protein Leryth_020815 [Lithospermum erythrorhizon]